MNRAEAEGQWLCQSAVGYVLLVGGMLVAEVPASPFANVPLVHPACLCFCGIPFLWYARRCGVIAVDGWDFAFIFIFMLGGGALELWALPAAVVDFPYFFESWILGWVLAWWVMRQWVMPKARVG